MRVNPRDVPRGCVRPLFCGLSLQLVNPCALVHTAAFRVVSRVRQKNRLPQMSLSLGSDTRPKFAVNFSAEELTAAHPAARASIRNALLGGKLVGGGYWINLIKCRPDRFADRLLLPVVSLSRRPLPTAVNADRNSSQWGVTPSSVRRRRSRYREIESLFEECSTR